MGDRKEVENFIEQKLLEIRQHLAVRGYSVRYLAMFITESYVSANNSYWPLGADEDRPINFTSNIQKEAE